MSTGKPATLRRMLAHALIALAGALPGMFLARLAVAKLPAAPAWVVPAIVIGCMALLLVLGRLWLGRGRPGA